MSGPVPLGQFHPLPDPWRWVGQAAWVTALAVAVLLQRWQVGLRRAERARWWASNGRDVLNFAALGLLVSALRVLGYPGPTALLIGATILMPLVLAAGFSARRGRLKSLAPLLAALLGAPVGLAPGSVHALVASVALRLAG